MVFIENRYLFLLAAALFPLIFLIFPVRRGDPDRPTPWYDWSIAAIAFTLLLWFAVESQRILAEGWEFAAPPTRQGLRRRAVAADPGIPAPHQRLADVRHRRDVSLYPVFADDIPNPLNGNPQSFPRHARLSPR